MLKLTNHWFQTAKYADTMFGNCWKSFKLTHYYDKTMYLAFFLLQNGCVNKGSSFQLLWFEERN